MEQNRFQQFGGTQNVSYQTQAPSLSVHAYAARTFLWMFLGLLVTFGIAAALAYTGVMDRLLSGNRGLSVVITLIPLIAMVVISMILGLRLQKMRVATARILFLVYSAVMGITIAFYLVYFDVRSVAVALGITAVFFGSLAALSYFMKWELRSIGPVLFAGLIALLILTIVNIFLRMPMLQTIICYVGVGIFLGYTAYDTAKIRDIYYTYANNDSAMLEKASIFAAFQLYLDFLNLFIYILRLVGTRSSD